MAAAVGGGWQAQTKMDEELATLKNQVHAAAALAVAARDKATALERQAAALERVIAAQRLLGQLQPRPLEQLKLLGVRWRPNFVTANKAHDTGDGTAGLTTANCTTKKQPTLQATATLAGPCTGPLTETFNSRGYFTFELEEEYMHKIVDKLIFSGDEKLYDRIFLKFDDDVTAIDDDKRRQRHLEANTGLLCELQDFLRAKVNENIGGDWHATVFVALWSLAGGEDQALHKDMTERVYKELGQREVHSCIITGSQAAQLLIKAPGETEAKTVDVPPYSVLVFHGRLVHAGKGYKDAPHKRLHCYLGGRELLEKLEQQAKEGIKPNDTGALLDTTDAEVDGQELSTSLSWE